MAFNHSKITISSLLRQLGIILFIAIAFYLVFPFPHDHRKARRTACMSNMRQIGLAMMQYAQDSDETLPPRQGRMLNGETGSWRMLIYPYARSNALFQCPENPVAKAWAYENRYDVQESRFGRSYAVNSTSDNVHSFGPFSGKFPKGFPLRAAAHPEALFTIVESTAAYNDFNVLLPEVFSWPTSNETQTGHLYFGHLGMTNVLYCDGHVKAKSPAAILSAQSLNPNAWTTDGAPFSPSNQATAISVIQYGAKQDQ